MASWVECQLCPKYCRIPEGGSGDCRIRINIDGQLVASTYGFPVSLHMDPMEKKPLYHFLPGTAIFSLATVGCNLHCRNCQNWSISQTNPEDVEAYAAPPDELIKVARDNKAISVAYTYSEPLAFYEYTTDLCIEARKAGLKNVLVTAAYLNEKPLRRLLPFVDAANVDLKAFADEFYRENCGGTLKPVLRNLELFVEMGVWTEVTNLIVPTLNDDMGLISKMCDWIVEKLGETVPLHFSRFTPRYQLRNLPSTPSATLLAAAERARAAGLKYVYIGNLDTPDGGHTYCPNPNCSGGRVALIERVGYTIVSNRLVNGRCPDCGAKVAGVWE